MPSVPSIPTIPDGVSSSTQVNQLGQALSFLFRPPLCDVRQSVAQSIPNGTWTALTFDVEDFDDDVDNVGGHSTSSNTSRFTARYPGRYEVGGGPAVVANNVGVRGGYWAVNGVTKEAGQVLLSASSAFESCIAAKTRMIYLAQGDYLELFAYQSSGGALNTATTAGAASNMMVRWAGSST